MKLALLISAAALCFASCNTVYAAADPRPPKPTDRDVITLQWSYPHADPVNRRFKVYSGNAAGTYNTVVEVTEGLEKSIDVTDTRGKVFFVVTAVDIDTGLESIPSNEVAVDLKGRPPSPTDAKAIRITILVD